MFLFKAIFLICPNLAHHDEHTHVEEEIFLAELDARCHPHPCIFRDGDCTHREQPHLTGFDEHLTGRIPAWKKQWCHTHVFFKMEILLSDNMSHVGLFRDVFFVFVSYEYVTCGSRNDGGRYLGLA